MAAKKAANTAAKTAAFKAASMAANQAAIAQTGGLSHMPVGPSMTTSTPRGLGTMSPAPQNISKPPPATGAPAKQVEPIFHTVPPRPQRLLHSEAYIRLVNFYIRFLEIWSLIKNPQFFSNPHENR